MKHTIKKFFAWFAIVSISIWANFIMADTKIELLDIKIKLIADGQAQITLNFSKQSVLPTEFSIDNPSKMIFDFTAVSNKISKSSASQCSALGVIKEVNFVEAEDKTRMVVAVMHVTPFKIERDGNNIIITLAGDAKMSSNSNTDADIAPKSLTRSKVKEDDDNNDDESCEISASVSDIPAVPSATTTTADNYNIKAIDFRRGESGEGRLIIELASDAAPIDFREVDNEMVLEYAGATIPDKLLRRFDVSDFGTPIKRVVVMKKDDSVLFKIQAVGDYDKVAYQLDNQYIVEVKSITNQEKEAVKAQKFKFTGERISLNFQDIEVRAVLQLLADFTGLNIVASDSVAGNVTLRLDNVPWDQALDFILKSKGLGKREDGNIVLIAPNEEIAAREQLELETMKQAETLAPLQSEYVQINYAKAADIEKMLNSEDNSLLSDRGVVSVDVRTNTLLVKDTADKLEEIEKFIEKLDVPIRQVLIEAQIVQTTDGLMEALGMHLGGLTSPQIGKYGVGVGGNVNTAVYAADTYKGTDYYGTMKSITSNTTGLANAATTTAQQAAAGAATTTTGSSSSSGSSGGSGGSTFTDPMQAFDFPANTTAPAGSIGLAISRLPGGTLLDLELRAAEQEAKSKVLARPKLMTLDQQKSSIESGVDIPYSTTAQAGATPTVSFKKAVLKLEVTPQITPNNKVLMTLTVNQDTPGQIYSSGPAINTTSLSTNILVDNGETVVLGGIFQLTHNKTVNKIPFFGDIPFIGRLFRDNSETNNRSEILIFVTPKVIKPIAMN